LPPLPRLVLMPVTSFVVNSLASADFYPIFPLSNMALLRMRRFSTWTAKHTHVSFFFAVGPSNTASNQVIGGCGGWCFMSHLRDQRLKERNETEKKKKKKQINVLTCNRTYKERQKLGFV
jgi:hypothetical protein